MTLFESICNINPVHVPVAPQEYQDFKAWLETDEVKKMGFEEKNKRKHTFYQQEFIRDYMEEKWEAELHNKTAINWLFDYKRNFMKENNTTEEHAIGTKMKQFLNFIGGQKDHFPALKINFEKLGMVNQ